MTTASQTKQNRIFQHAANQKLSDGLTKQQQTIPSFTVNGTSIKTADIVASLQARIKTAEAVDFAKATWQSAVKADRDERAKTKSLVSGVRQTLVLMFAGSIDTLAEFGLRSRKAHAPLTPEQQALAVARARATRKARNTMGSRQKAKIKGTVASTAPVVPPTATPPVVTPHDAPPPGGTPRLS